MAYKLSTWARPLVVALAVTGLATLRPVAAQQPTPPAAENPAAEAPAAEEPAEAEAEAAPRDAAESQAEPATEKLSAPELLAAGDRLAKEKKYEQALTQYKNAYELLVPEIRGLPFKNPVQPRFMTRSQLKEYMAAEIEKEIPEHELKLLDRSLKVLGFVPYTLDVEEMLLNLYTEQVGGFYNPRTKEMFLILEDPVKRTFLTRWLRGPEFDSAEQRTTLSHEMTHALADQHYDLGSLDKVARGNDDMSMAISSLIEGEATLVMMSEMLGEGVAPEMLVQLEPGRIDAAFQIMNWTMPLIGGRALRSAPSIFQKTLVFPYHKGIVFVLNLTNRDGWSAVDKAFRDPPISTEQILHPEKYWNERDVPMAIELPELKETLGESWTSLGGNSLGELQLGILLENSKGGDRAAPGWDGDRYEVFESTAGDLGLVWYTTWDSETDAREFATAIGRYFATRPARDGQAATQVAPEQLDEQLEQAFAADSPQPQQWQHAMGEQQLHVGLRGADVVVLSGFAAAQNDAMLPAIWQSLKSPLALLRPEEAGNAEQGE